MRSHDINVLDDNELDEMVAQTWPQKNGFESCAAFEWRNDTDHLLMGVGMPTKYKEGTPADSIAARQQHKLDDIEEFKAHKGDRRPLGWGPYQLMEALVFAGRIQVGNYCVRVSG